MGEVDFCIFGHAFRLATSCAALQRYACKHETKVGGFITGRFDPGAHYVASDEELGAFDPVSVLNGKFRDAVAALSDELRGLSEDDLHERVNPTAADWKMRQNFTNAMKKARALNEEVVHTARVYDDVVSRTYFHEWIITNPNKIAFISRPMVEHTDYYNAIHREGLNKLFQILKTLPPDSKHLPQILKLVETAGNRVHGMVVQKTQVDSRNLNVEVSAKQLPSDAPAEDISKRIEAVQAKLLNGPKDVTPTEEI